MKSPECFKGNVRRLYAYAGGLEKHPDIIASQATDRYGPSIDL